MTWYFAFNILTIDGFIFWRRPEGYRRPESLHSLISDLRRCCTLFVITNEFCHQRCILGKIMYWLFCVWLKCITLFPFKCFIFTEAFALLIFKILPYTLVMGLCHYLFFFSFFFFFHNIFKLELAMEETLLTALWPFYSVTRYFFQQFSVHTAI